MSRCIHVYSFVARNHGGIPFSGVCPFAKFYVRLRATLARRDLTVLEDRTFSHFAEQNARELALVVE